MSLFPSLPLLATPSCTYWRGGGGWLRALLPWALLCSALLTPLVAGAGALVKEELREYELKAVYLYNFLHFVYWPAAAGGSGSAPVGIGVVGESPFGSALAELQEQVRASGRGELVVREYGPYRPGLELQANSLLFVCASEQEHLPAILARLAGSPVLTVADLPGFLAAGGMIALVTGENGKVGWRINRSAVQRAGLTVSAKLLQMALPVAGEEGGDD